MRYHATQLLSAGSGEIKEEDQAGPPSRARVRGGQQSLGTTEIPGTSTGSEPMAAMIYTWTTISELLRQAR